MARRRDAAVIPARDPRKPLPDIKKDRECAASAYDADPSASRHSSGPGLDLSRKSRNMRAILSVSDKSGLVDLARGLSSLGVELVSTGGTSRAISAAGIPVTNVSDVTGFPEMMDGRV